MKNYTYYFGPQGTEGGAEMKDLLGGKGANLAEMSRIGIPVPPGFTISTEACIEYFKSNNKLPEGLMDQVRKNMAKIESDMNRKFGDAEKPLLVSVRSGARVSMPGMMDTVLNLGLNDQSVKGLAKEMNNPRFAYDSYRRFIQMFGNVVYGVAAEHFEKELQKKKEETGAKYDTDLSAEDLKDLAERFKKIFTAQTGKEFPQDPWEQLTDAIMAVFRSWNTKRAIDYRRVNKIPDDWGTAVNVVTMVFGNMGDDSATGVAFTRDPATGEKRFFGEFLKNAQGEDVVAGIRTPQPVNKAGRTNANQITLEEEMPEAYKDLETIYKKLEKHYRDMQDMEFTIQKGKLWMLQTRNGKRTAMAAIRIAVDMEEEGLITKEEAVMRVEPAQLDQLLHERFDPKAEKKHFGKGINASPGAASGLIALDPDKAVEWAKEGKPVILVRTETSPDDFHGMVAARGILTSRGGATSHAAVVARGIGKPCIVGAENIEVNYNKHIVISDGITLKEGDEISIDGSVGEIYVGNVPTSPSEITAVVLGQMKPNEAPMYHYYEKLMSWANDIRRLGIRTNSDTPHDSWVARKFGAEGIGLCRTEHMFFVGDRILAVREMIFASDIEGRKKALDKIRPMQQSDFEGIFKEMEGLPVTVRLLDPPLHEFLPHTDEEYKELSNRIGIPVDELQIKGKQLKEANPMLGHRGCRLGIVHPEITEMQARAIFTAAANLIKKGVKVYPEVMVPLVGHKAELDDQEVIIRRVADEVQKEENVKIEYKVGTMIEVPRAALTADEIAETAEFFSFGTNDLTQMTLGVSRDDAGKFLPLYVERGFYKVDPFQSIDRNGVGQLMGIGVSKGRKTRPKLKVGICGEHGGDPASIELCDELGLNYVSCSPYRVPIARLAAAQATLKHQK